MLLTSSVVAGLPMCVCPVCVAFQIDTGGRMVGDKLWQTSIFEAHPFALVDSDK